MAGLCPSFLAQSNGSMANFANFDPDSSFSSLLSFGTSNQPRWSTGSHAPPRYQAPAVNLSDQPPTSPLTSSCRDPARHKHVHACDDKQQDTRGIDCDAPFEQPARQTVRDKDRWDEQEERQEESLFAVPQEEGAEHCGNGQAKENDEQRVGLWSVVWVARGFLAGVSWRWDLVAL